jgi:hypothetical protein
LQGHALGAVPDLKPSKSHTDLLGIDNDSYFNAGLLVLDLKKIRSGALFTQVRKYLTQNTDKIKYVDQDGLNAVFENDYLRLDQGYNYQHYFSKWFKPLSKSEISIIHYTGTIKPKYYISPHPLQGFFTPYVEKAGFKQDTVTPSKFVKKTFIGLFMYLKRLGFEDQLMTLQRLFKP